MPGYPTASTFSEADGDRDRENDMDNATAEQHVQDIVIHIGWHKAASTFLQNGLFRQIGANYQPLAAFPAELREAFGTAPSLIDYVEMEEGFDPELLRTATLPRDAGGGGGLTQESNEELSGHSHGFDLIDPFVTARNLAAAFPDARIVAVVRNQFDYLLSLYCYRVAVRGHEHRSLARFVAEDLADGLQKHLEYDRLIGEYTRLFGPERVRVLPLEMLRADPEAFLRQLTDFIGRTPSTAISRQSSNESTRHAFTVNFWRPFNYLFSVALRLALILSARNPADFDARRRKMYPFLKLRYRYYQFKRAATKRLARLPWSRRLTAEDVPGRDALEACWADSNGRLEAFGVLACSLKDYGYPVRPGASER
jgi:hypothetical protein